MLNNRTTLFLLLSVFFLFSSLSKFQVDAQIVVLGMHHSGTSAVTKMISMMGASVGTESDMIVSSSKEFYERKDVVELNDLLFEHGGVLDHNKKPTWIGYGFDQEILESNEALMELFKEKATEIFLKLSQEGKTWTMKDPRLSLTAKYWFRVYDTLVEEGKLPKTEATCVIVHRDLFPILKTLWKWSQDQPNGINADEWLQAWNAYMLTIGEACADRKMILVRNVDAWRKEEYITNFNQIFDALKENYADLELPPLKDIQKMASELRVPRPHDTQLEEHRSKVFKPVLGHLTTEILQRIHRGEVPIPNTDNLRISSVWSEEYSSPESVLPVFEPTPSTLTVVSNHFWRHVDTVSSGIQGIFSSVKDYLFPTEETSISDQIKKEAYVTLLTGDNPLYIGLALSLGHSIRQFDTDRDMVALAIKGSVSKHWRPILEAVGYKVQYVSQISEPWLGKSSIKGCAAPEDIINRWGKLTTKLNTWNLPYDKVVFLDSDIIMVSNADKVFEVDGFGAGSGNFAAAGLFNAGYMVLNPSKKDFNALLKLRKSQPARQFGNILDCTEMGLLNQYFHDRVTLLPMASPYNVVDSPFVHWYGDHKPWENLDTDCYPSPVYANKLWSKVWKSTKKFMVERIGEEDKRLKSIFKAVDDKRDAKSSITQHREAPLLTSSAYSNQKVNDPYLSTNNPYLANPYLDPYLASKDPYLAKGDPYLVANDPYLTSNPYLTRGDPYLSDPYLLKNDPYLSEPYLPYLPYLSGSSADAEEPVEVEAKESVVLHEKNVFLIQ